MYAPLPPAAAHASAISEADVIHARLMPADAHRVAQPSYERAVPSIVVKLGAECGGSSGGSEGGGGDGAAAAVLKTRMRRTLSHPTVLAQTRVS